MIDATNVFIIPTVAGLVLAAFSYRMFRLNDISPKFFAISLLVSFTLMFSFVIFSVVSVIRDFFGIVYTFVFLFGIAIVGIIALLVYLILLIGSLKREISNLWQELALVQEGRYVDDPRETGRSSTDQHNDEFVPGGED